MVHETTGFSERQSRFIETVKRHNDILKSGGRDPRVYVLTLGCQQNEADSEKIKGMALSMGYTESDRPEGSSLIVVNTCSVREHAESRALSLIGQFKHIKAADRDTVIAVCGCMASRPEMAETIKKSYPYVDIVFGTSMLDRFPELLAQRLTTDRRVFTAEDGCADICEGVPVKRESSFKAWVSVMYGCNNFCSYCIVPYVRGRERSRRKSDVVAEVRELAAAGYRDITLLGQNVNSYGRGLDEATDFPSLLGELARIEGDFLIRFMTSHPKDVPDALISVIAENEKLARHFHLPLQSGSDRILREMNRRYDTASYLKTVEKLRRSVPGISVTSDIIVGFPGETEDDFSMTLETVREAGFDMIYPFIYSPRSGTPAASRTDTVDEEVKGERIARLIELQNSLSRERNMEYVGSERRVLIEGKSKKGEEYFSARTSSAKLVHVRAEGLVPGKFINVKITGADTFALYSEEEGQKDG